MFTKNLSKVEEIEHTADIGIFAHADTLPELIANLSFGMLHIITGEIEVQTTNKRTIKVESPSLIDMIVRWLSEINFLLIVKHFLVTGIENIKIDEIRGKVVVSANLYGKESKSLESTFKTEIKAVTYHKLLCEKRNGGYIGQVIFDI
jgi:SHS2 domain-containing protein